MGAYRIIDWMSEASLALVPLGMSPIQVAEPPASIADALPVMNSARIGSGVWSRSLLATSKSRAVS